MLACMFSLYRRVEYVPAKQYFDEFQQKITNAKEKVKEEKVINQSVYSALHML